MANRLIGAGSTRREVQIAKHAEAVERNQYTVPDKRRAFWRERGFTRQSQAASLIKGVVVLTNAQAKERKQRSADWPLIPEEITNAVRGQSEEREMA